MSHSHQSSFLPRVLSIVFAVATLTANNIPHIEVAAAAPPQQMPIPTSEPQAAQITTGTLSYTVNIPTVMRARTTCLEKPKLVSPPDGAVLSTIAPTYTIQFPSMPVTHTIIGIADNPLFVKPEIGHLIYGRPNMTLSYRSFRNLKTNTTYYWRAYSVCGNDTSDFTAVYSFTTASSGVVLPAPTLLSPANNLSGVGSTLNLSWTPISGAYSYRVIYGPTSVINLLGPIASQNSYQLTFLRPNTTYEWSVSALNEFGYGTESEKRLFTTTSFSQ